MKTYLVMLASFLMVTSALAQPAGGGRDGGRDGGPGQPGAPRDQQDFQPGQGGGPGGDRPMPPDGPGGGFGGGGGPGGPNFERRGRGPAGPGGQAEIMRAYLELVDRYARMSRDATTSGIAAVLSANDLLRPKGAAAGIEYFEKLLPTVKNEAVARAIRLTLIDLYKQSDQRDKALEMLGKMIAETPTDSASTASH